jgi:hypothetical protein
MGRCGVINNNNNNISGIISQLIAILNAKFPCSPSIPISSVPFTITASGKYCVTQDLIFSGAGAAITVLASNVTINFENHSLTLTNPTATGILASGVNELEILNDVIELASPTVPTAITSAAIRLINVIKAHIDNVFTRRTLYGIYATGSEDIIITNSEHRDHPGILIAGVSVSGSGIRVESGNGITIDNTTISGTFGAPLDPNNPVFSIGIEIRNSSKSVIIKNVNIPLIDLGIGLFSVDNVIIDNTNINLSSFTFFNFIQTGGLGTPATNIIVRNSTFVTRNNPPTMDGLALLNGNNAIIENVTIEADSVPDVTQGVPTAGARHIGVSYVPGLTFNDVQIRNVVVSGPNSDAILVDSGNNVTFDNINVSGAIVNNVHLNLASNITVKNSDIQSSSQNGVNIEPTSSANVILNNNIRNNLGSGVLVAGNNNTISSNNFILNGTNITNTGVSNITPNNTFNP